MQQFEAIGYIGREPEQKQASMTVAKFSVGVTEKVKGEDQTEWFSCVAFDKRADYVLQYLHKGDLVFIRGKIKSYSYTAQDGQQKNGFEVNLSEISCLRQKNADTNSQQPQRQYQQPVQQRQQPRQYQRPQSNTYEEQEFAPTMDDIPF